MMLKGRDKLYAEIIGEVPALAESLQVLAPEPLGIIVLARPLAPILKKIHSEFLYLVEMHEALGF